MTDRFDLDRSVAAAWTAFRAELADHVAEMRDGQVLLLVVAEYDNVAEAADPSNGSTPCVQFYAWGATDVRCEVLSNRYLSVERAMSETDEAVVAALGFIRPPLLATTEDPTNWFLDRPRAFADEVAVAAVTVLRDVFGAAHPTFLVADSTGVPFTAVPPAVTGAPELDLRRAVTTTSPEHRRRMIGATLEHMLGFVPFEDEDGDLPLRLGGTWMYVCPMDGAPFVQILAPVASDVTNRTRAAEVLVDVNRRWPHVKLLLLEDRVVATIEVTVVPYVPQQLLDMLAVMERFVVEAAPALLEKLGGPVHTGQHDDEDVRDGLPDGLCTLVEEVYELGEEVTVDRALELGARSRARIHLYLDIARHLESRAIDAVDTSTEPHERDRAEDEVHVWGLTAALLTAAHRRLAGSGPPSPGLPGNAQWNDGQQMGLFDNPTDPSLFD